MERVLLHLMPRDLTLTNLNMFTEALKDNNLDTDQF